MLSRFVSFLGSTRAIFLGFLIGGVIGYLLGPRAEALKPVGDAFISLLKLVVIPLVFVSIVAGVYRTGNLARLGSIGLRTVVYYLTTTSIAIGVGMTLVTLVKPGMGVELESSGFQPEVEATASLVTFLTRMIPDNIFKAFAEMNILGIILFAIGLGVALLFSGEKASPLVSLLDALEDVFLKLTRGILHLAPIGVIGLLAPTIGTFGFSILIDFWKFAAVVLGGLAIHAFILFQLFSSFFQGAPLRHTYQRFGRHR